MRALVHAMGDPQACYPVVHVTGTNGKGSTSRMCAALLAAEGLRVGLYLSPHLERLNERVSIAGEEICDDELCSQLSALAELEVFLGVQFSWFELVTAAAYRWFADEAVDAAVIEVGLGGRYDATNVVEAAVAVVTNVELDHTDILGGTRAEIAGEKAGIIKSSSVVVLGEVDPAIAAVFDREAASTGAGPLWRRGEDFGGEGVRLAVGGQAADLYTPAGRYAEVYLPLHGYHQVDNAAAALAAAQALVGNPLSEGVVVEAFASVRVPGRLEVVARRPVVVLDGAHNPAGARAAGAALAEDFASARRVIVVMGCLRGRDPGELLDGLIGSGPKDPAAPHASAAPDAGPGVESSAGPRSGAGDRIAVVVACTPLSPRAQPPGAVTSAAAARGIETVECTTPAEAVEEALGLAGEDDLVLVTGSLYVVGAARSALLATH
ncbi:MAG: bifunctional folylpolyglutamate synthase/dihydrofolate synthase [Acidimicrobiales bacterium]